MNCQGFVFFAKNHVNLERFFFPLYWTNDPSLSSKGLPIGAMYGMFTYNYQKNQPNVGKYTIHSYMDPMG